VNPNLKIRELEDRDLSVISDSFTEIGWHKIRSQYERYLQEQKEGTRIVLIAELNSDFAGHVTLLWQSAYPHFRENGIPEIADLNVLPPYRRQGIASALVQRTEEIAVTRSSIIGIGVGLHPGYNAAQRMYVLRGYIPDGRGVTYRNEYVREGEQVAFDDDLVLYLTKEKGRESG
jgi:GNAT superfamily N-acetyltransferase